MDQISSVIRELHSPDMRCFSIYYAENMGSKQCKIAQSRDYERIMVKSNHLYSLISKQLQPGSRDQIACVHSMVLPPLQV